MAFLLSLAPSAAVEFGIEPDQQGTHAPTGEKGGTVVVPKRRQHNGSKQIDPLKTLTKKDILRIFET
jgi:hypothetical protein